jgi:transposase
MALVEKKQTTIRRLHRLLFGPKTEKTRQVLGQDQAAAAPSEATTTASRPQRPGHGRNGVQKYPGARHHLVPHPQLQPGDICPDCSQGKLYRVKTPGVVARITAQPPIAADIFELEKLRCSRCGALFTAPTPPQAGTTKYDPNVGLMLGLLRFGAGVPHYRLEKWQKDFGVPLPASTQWELIEETFPALEPVYEKLFGLAATAQILHNDDTKMRVQSLRQEIDQATEKDERTGIFTTGIVAQAGGHTIALFFTGRRHAGENFDELLQRRPEGLAPPIQMCDALSRNLSKRFKTEVSHCLTHGRRAFVDIVDAFPTECRRVLEDLGEVYHYDAQSKERGLTPEERLRFHQEHSGPVMNALKLWMMEQLALKKVEPNSVLGEAMDYLLKYWDPLTLFLRRAGAPLDNNICEQALKMAILHRKNSLGYKTQRGAQVGDLFMSLIHTCRLAGVNVFDYLTAVQQNAAQVRERPELWLPWNYPNPGKVSN